MEGLPTLRDVARKSGLAISTVSAVCRGKGAFYHISPKTQARVLRIAEAIGYRPNQLAVSLKTGVSRFVPVLGRTYRVPITQERQHNIAQLLTQQGFQVLLYDFHWFDRQEKNLLASVREIPFAGLIVSDLNEPRLHQELWPLWRKVPCILVDSGQPAGFDHVYLDRHQVAYQAARHLLQHGYQRIVYTIPEGRNYWLLNERRRGFIKAMKEFGKTVGQENFVWVNPKPGCSYQLGLEIGQKIIRNRPEAVMALNDQLAIGLIRAFSEKGLRVPEDIAVVGSENLPEGQFCQVHLTTVDFLAEKVATEVVNLFRKRLAGDWSDFPKKIVVSPQIVVRRSCGCLGQKTLEVADEKERKQ
ncbi:MAG: LacI family transcriptional regulator [Candidatus Omnitrophica bacterium]|nr:LacI family transcriptional regulator [Candidatus Omnitrophota bacterium]